MQVAFFLSRVKTSRRHQGVTLAVALWVLGHGLLTADLALAEKALEIPMEPSPLPVEWALYPDDCPSPNNGTLVACGAYGTFYFGSGEPDCADVRGSESPPKYAAPSAAVIEVPHVPIARLDPMVRFDPMVRLDSLARSLDGGLPCDQGTCFESPGGETGSKPWIAVIDWDTWHGWTTGWSAISMSGLPTHLYPLDGDDLKSFLGPGVGDAHLLVRLCEIVEAVDRQGIIPPSVLNMSFGRYYAPGADARDGATCDPNTLSCQIGRLFDHLSNAGVAITAASGNYGQAQFPAVYDTVLATGSLDLARLSSLKKVAASWETPDLVEVLLPGYGICLETLGEGGTTGLWAAPPGSSYASSLFAGWLADTLVTEQVSNPSDFIWGLSWSDLAGCYLLSEELPPVCNPRFDRLLARALGGAPETCWSPSQDTYVEAESLDFPPQQGVTDLYPSLVEWVEIVHAPTPESQICLPCVDGGNGNGLMTNPGGPQGRGIGLDLLIDLSGSSAIASNLTLEELYLRVEEDFFPLLQRSVGEHVAGLDKLADGAADSLLVHDGRSLFGPDQQPSLLFVLCNGPGDCFWSSIPVLALE